MIIQLSFSIQYRIFSQTKAFLDDSIKFLKNKGREIMTAIQVWVIVGEARSNA